MPTLLDPSLKLSNYTVTSKNGILIIGPATPIVNLSVQAGQSTALLTAQVLNAGAIFPTGTVQFSEGTTALGQPVTLSQISAGTPPIASLQVPLTPGTHTISVNYSGDSTYTAAAATPVTVVIGGPPPGLRFVPVAPCRVADTRNPAGPFGGPFITGGTSRGFRGPQQRLQHSGDCPGLFHQCDGGAKRTARILDDVPLRPVSTFSFNSQFS